LNYKYAAPTALPKMKSAAKFSIVLVTAPDLKTARALAKAARNDIKNRNN
jgi:hypothetical protein